MMNYVDKNNLVAEMASEPDSSPDKMPYKQQESVLYWRGVPVSEAAACIWCKVYL